jgi:hypothetical protein
MAAGRPERGASGASENAAGRRAAAVRGYINRL